MFHVFLSIERGVPFCVFYPNSLIQEVPFSTQLPLFDKHCEQLLKVLPGKAISFMLVTLAHFRLQVNQIWLLSISLLSFGPYLQLLSLT